MAGALKGHFSFRNDSVGLPSQTGRFAQQHSPTGLRNRSPGSQPNPMEISLVEGKKKAKLLFYHIPRFWMTCDSLAPILGGKKIKCLGFLILNKAQQHRATSGCQTRNEAEILADIWCQILIRGNQPPDQGDSL